MTRTDDQNYENRPDGISKQNWTNLVNYWYSPEFQEKEKGKFGELDFYKSVYTKKDGSFKESTLSQQFLEDANNKVKECLASSSSKSRVDIENEVFDDLMYNGEVPKPVKKQNEDLRQKNQALKSKFDDTTQSLKAIASHLA
ncbi:Zygote defective protein 12 [Bienertia sinuspersici]